jgi:hypothetical protein
MKLLNPKFFLGQSGHGIVARLEGNDEAVTGVVVSFDDTDATPTTLLRGGMTFLDGPLTGRINVSPPGRRLP